MENTTKKTKTMLFEELREIVIDVVKDEEKHNELVDFIDKQIELLVKRKAAAADRAAKKKEESDALTEEILGLIGEDLVTVDEIVIAINREDVTRNKVTARLGKLFKNGAIVKETVKVDGNKRMAYKLADAADADAE
jgi:DNA-binding transcriptional ArsR family regulator